MAVVFKWKRLVLDVTLVVILLLVCLNYKTTIYLLHQAKGQFIILFNTETFEEYADKNKLTVSEKSNLELINQIKTFSIDSLAYEPTANFTTIYNQKNIVSLWALTASKSNKLEAYEWNFPLVGKVTYKGFFKKNLAELEMKKLHDLGYDVELRGVSAWSTLGWLSDPILSNTLKYSKGSFCNLLFHELFHATYYKESTINFNENMASFIAHKATLLFLANDSLAKRLYEESFADNLVYDKFMLRQIKLLNDFYSKLNAQPKAKFYLDNLKESILNQICDSIEQLPLKNKSKFKNKIAEMEKAKNAYFIGFEQYDSLQDSIELVFNKIYRGNLKKLVQDLKANKIYY